VLLQGALMAGLGLIWLRNGDEITRALLIAPVLILVGGFMLLISLALWWIDKKMPSEEQADDRGEPSV